MQACIKIFVQKCPQNVCKGLKIPVYPVSLARKAGKINAQTVTSFNKCAHSHNRMYILSPLGLSDLWRDILLKPAADGKYRYIILAPKTIFFVENK